MKEQRPAHDASLSGLTPTPPPPACTAPLQYASRQAAVEDASQQVGVHVAALKRRMVQAEAGARQRQKQAETLAKQLEAARWVSGGGSGPVPVEV